MASSYCGLISSALLSASMPACSIGPYWLIIAWRTEGSGSGPGASGRRPALLRACEYGGTNNFRPTQSGKSIYYRESVSLFIGNVLKLHHGNGKVFDAACTGQPP